MKENDTDELRVLVLRDVSFLVRGLPPQLSEHLNADNSIEAEALRNPQGWMQGLLDVQTHRLYPAQWENMQDDVLYFHFELPVMDLLGKPVQKKVLDDLNKSFKKAHEQTYLGGNALYWRLLGKLPTMEMAGETYFIDVRVGEFRHVEDVSRIIRFDQLYHNGNAEGPMLGFYNTKTRQMIADPEHNVTSKNVKDVIAVEFPKAVEMDPIGYARKINWMNPSPIPETTYVHKYPVQESQQAKEIPLRETILKSLVKENKQTVKEQQKRPTTQKRRH